MVSSVWDVTFDRPPGRVALKVSAGTGAFDGERAGLGALRQAGFPVPDVCFLLGPGRNGLPGLSVLGLEWIVEYADPEHELAYLEVFATVGPIPFR